MSRRRILVLTPRYPYPVIGGDRLRIYEICRQLARDYDVTLLSLCETRDEFDAIMEDDGIFVKIEKVRLPKWRSIFNVLLAIPTKIPLQVAYYKSSLFEKKLRELMPSHDIILAHLIRCGEYARSLNVPKILEMTDAISMNYQGINKIHIKRRLLSYIYKLEASRLVDYERGIIKDFSLVILVSELDRKFVLNGHNDDNVIVCSNGVDLARLPFKSREKAMPIGVFIGNMTSLQNLDACHYFVEKVLPKVRNQIDFRFRIVGRIKDEDAIKFTSYEGVEVLPNVESIYGAVHDAQIGLAPIRIGAGVQNKVLEYMALGLPVISSPLALEGFQAKPNVDLLVAETSDEFTEAIIRLSGDCNLRKSLAMAGHQYVKNNHSWPDRLKLISEKIEKMTLKSESSV